MKNGHFVNIYCLYDKEGTLVFTGTSRECREFADSTKGAFFKSFYQCGWYKRKYRIELSHEEEILQKECRICHKVFSTKDLVWKTRKDGSRLPTNLCKKCRNIQDSNTAWRKKNVQKNIRSI